MERCTDLPLLFIFATKHDKEINNHNTMSNKFESTVREIAYSQTSVYAALSNLENLSKIKDRLPEDKMNGLEFDADSVSMEAPMVGKIQLRIIEREEPKTIKFESVQSPLPFNFWIQLLPLTDTSCKMKLTLQTDVNPFMLAMVKKPLTEGLEKLADTFQMIHYE